MKVHPSSEENEDTQFINPVEVHSAAMFPTILSRGGGATQHKYVSRRVEQELDSDSELDDDGDHHGHKHSKTMDCNNYFRNYLEQYKNLLESNENSGLEEELSVTTAYVIKRVDLCLDGKRIFVIVAETSY